MIKAVIYGRSGFLGGALAKAIKNSNDDGIYINCRGRVHGIGGNQRFAGAMIRDNLNSAIKIFDSAVAHQIERVVNFGSTCSYSPDCAVPFDPKDILKNDPEPTNGAYAMAKRAIYVMSKAYAEQYGMDNLYLVLPNLYGPGDHFGQDAHVIPAMIEKFQKAIDTQAPHLTLWGSGKAEREFLYIDDAVALILKAMQIQKNNDPIHLASGQMIPVFNLAYLLKRLMGYEGEILWDQTKPDGQLKRQLKTGLTLESYTSLEKGLTQTILYYRSLTKSSS